PQRQQAANAKYEGGDGDFHATERTPTGFAEAPSSKLQAPDKSQAPNLNRKFSVLNTVPNRRGFPIQRPFRTSTVGVWNLELLWCLELGTWSFSRTWSLFST